MDDDNEILLAKLKETGGVANNRTTRLALGWDWVRYSSARRQLIEDGIAQSQRGGPGGSTALLGPMAGNDDALEVVGEATPNAGSCTEVPTTAKEATLYPDILTQLKEKWAVFENYHAIIACDTSSQGRRDTGGKWTRPDISVVAIKKFKFLPNQHFEIVTFEVKTKYQMGVEGVFEALSHRDSVHRSYLVINASVQDFENSQESERVIRLLQKHEVGLYLAEDISDFETWVELVSAPRWEPDPFRINEFLQKIMPSAQHEEIIKLLK